MTDEDRARIVAAVLCGELSNDLGAKFLKRGVTNWRTEKVHAITMFYWSDPTHEDEFHLELKDF